MSKSLTMTLSGKMRIVPPNFAFLFIYFKI